MINFFYYLRTWLRARRAARPDYVSREWLAQFAAAELKGPHLPDSVVWQWPIDKTR